jgi:hypothetical protein
MERARRMGSSHPRQDCRLRCSLLAERVEAVSACAARVWALPGLENVLRYRLEHNCVVRGLPSRTARGRQPAQPGSRADRCRGNAERWLHPVEDVIAGDLFGRELFGDGDGAVEVVSVPGAIRGNSFPRLSPRRRVLRACVNDATDTFELALQQQVSMQIGRRAQIGKRCRCAILSPHCWRSTALTNRYLES